jgi:imidazole glycerol-phosphate synthase subunit HisH
MKAKRVTVLDYGVGNLFSVRRALEHCGAEVLFATDPGGIAAAERLVLPGVGAFADGMQGLRERGLPDPVREYAASGRPLLGICLGMQLLLSQSEEFGAHEGLGLIPGRVVAIPPAGLDGRAHKIPHIGWSRLLLPQGLRSWEGSILSGIREDEAVYLVHSFTGVPESVSHRLADCLYDGCLIAAAVRSGNVYGCQFHPEKSGPVGLRILAAFLAL